MRLLKREVGRATGRHIISLLIDLQCFYDSVELTQLLQLWEPLDFPPAYMNMIYEVYSHGFSKQKESPRRRFTARKACWQAALRLRW